MNKNNNHFLKHSKSSIKSDDDLIYYDILATNYTKETSSIRLNFEETRTSPFLQKPSEHASSVELMDRAAPDGTYYSRLLQIW